MNIKRLTRLLFAFPVAFAVAAMGCAVEGADDGDDSTEREGEAVSRVTHALNYGRSLIGKPYGWWYSGPLPAYAPMWTASGPAPSPGAITSTNCTGLTNLMLRSVGRQPPTDPNGWYGKGGTAAYYARYYDVSERFNPTVRYPAGTLLIRNYRNNVDQGHVAVVTETGHVLHSFANCYGCSAPGVNASYTVAQSHAGYYYELAVRPANWLGAGSINCAYGDGLYCGGNGVSGATNTLYRCSAGSRTLVRVCASGCVARAAGVDDACQ